MVGIVFLVIMILILIGVISKLVKKTREVRASFRNTFGGGEDKTREDATRIIMESSKNKVVPRWAIEDAATELLKYNIGESQLANENQLTENLMDLGYSFVDVPKDMFIKCGTKKMKQKASLRDILAS